MRVKRDYMDRRANPGRFQDVPLAVDDTKVNRDVAGKADYVARLSLIPWEGNAAGALGTGVVGDAEGRLGRP